MSIKEARIADTALLSHGILVVDDELSSRRVLRLTLALSGMTNVTECADGNEARTVIETREFAVALLDLVMPGVSGFDLLTLLRGTRSRTCVIITSGLSDSQTISQCREAGAFDFLAKPIDRERLLTVVHQGLHRYAGRLA